MAAVAKPMLCPHHELWPAAELSDDQNYGKQNLKVSAAGVDGFQEDLVTKDLKPKFVSSDDLLGNRLRVETGQ